MSKSSQSKPDPASASVIGVGEVDPQAGQALLRVQGTLEGIGGQGSCHAGARTMTHDSVNETRRMRQRICSSSSGLGWRPFDEILRDSIDRRRCTRRPRVGCCSGQVDYCSFVQFFMICE
jgi:hypothetical protein